MTVDWSQVFAVLSVLSVVLGVLVPLFGVVKTLIGERRIQPPYLISRHYSEGPARETFDRPQLHAYEIEETAGGTAYSAVYGRCSAERYGGALQTRFEASDFFQLGPRGATKVNTSLTPTWVSDLFVGLLPEGPGRVEVLVCRDRFRRCYRFHAPWGAAETWPTWWKPWQRRPAWTNWLEDNTGLLHALRRRIAYGLLFVAIGIIGLFFFVVRQSTANSTGTITFGSNFSPGQGAILHPHTTFRRSETVRWVAHFLWSLAPSTVTWGIYQVYPGVDRAFYTENLGQGRTGPEILVTLDAETWPVTTLLDLGAHVPGTFLVRYFHSGSALAQGEFRILP